eukprot:jgi/Undpi1/9600/HiC_scaffold_27.g12056.m1
MGIGESPPILRLLADGELDHKQQKRERAPSGEGLSQHEEVGPGFYFARLVSPSGEVPEKGSARLLAGRGGWRNGSACGAVERSLIPDDLRGLPVWRQDIRWSLLGFALERTEGSLPGKKAVVSGRGAELPSYLDWMEVGLQMCMKEDIDEMPGMYGYFVVGREAPPWLAAAEQLDAEHVSDVVRARCADAAFCAAIEASGSAGRVIAAAAREEDSDVSMEDDSSDNLGRGRGSGSGGDGVGGEEDGIDGVPMRPLPMPAQLLSVTAMEPEEKMIHDGPVVLPLPQASMPRPPGKPSKDTPAHEADVSITQESELFPAATEVTLGSEARRAGGADDFAEVQAPHPTTKSSMGKGAGGGGTTKHGGSEGENAGKVGPVAAVSNVSITLPLKRKGEGAKVNDGDQGKVGPLGSSGGGGSGGGSGGDDASNALREAEEAKRQRAKALAKERGRERGKQRAEEREAEKEAQRQRRLERDKEREERELRRHRGINARALIRERAEWSNEVKERCKRDEKLEYSRRASAMDDARAADLSSKRRLPRERSTSKANYTTERRHRRGSDRSSLSEGVGGDGSGSRGSRGSSHVNDATAPNRASEGRLPSPPAWSAWRSVSSGDSSSTPEADGLAGKGRDVRSVTQSNVSGGGFRIHVHRGASLEQPNDDSDGQENHESTRRIAEYRSGRSWTLGSSGESRPNLSDYRRHDAEVLEARERGSSRTSKDYGPTRSFEGLARSQPARRHRDSPNRYPRRGRSRPTSSEQRNEDRRREIDSARYDIRPRVSSKAGGREQSRSGEGRRLTSSEQRNEDRRREIDPWRYDTRSRVSTKAGGRERSLSRGRNSPPRREDPKRPRPRSRSRQHRRRSRSRSRSNRDKRQTRRRSPESHNDELLPRGQAPKAVRVEVTSASSPKASTKTNPTPRTVSVTRDAATTAPDGAMTQRSRNRLAGRDAVGAGKEKAVVGTATSVGTPAPDCGGSGGGSSKTTPVTKKVNLARAGTSNRSTPSLKRFAFSGQGERGTSAATRGIGGRPGGAANRLAESGDEVEEGEISAAVVPAVAASSARKAADKIKQLPPRDRKTPTRKCPPPGQLSRASQPALAAADVSSSAVDNQANHPVLPNQPEPASVADSIAHVAVDQLSPVGRRPSSDQPVPDAAVSKSAADNQRDRPLNPGQPPLAGTAEPTSPASVHHLPPPKQTPDAADISTSAVAKQPNQPVLRPNQPVPAGVVVDSTSPADVDHPPPAGQQPAPDQSAPDAVVLKPIVRDQPDRPVHPGQPPSAGNAESATFAVVHQLPPRKQAPDAADSLISAVGKQRDQLVMDTIQPNTIQPVLVGVVAGPTALAAVEQPPSTGQLPVPAHPSPDAVDVSISARMSDHQNQSVQQSHLGPANASVSDSMTTSAAIDCPDHQPATNRLPPQSWPSTPAAVDRTNQVPLDQLSFLNQPALAPVAPSAEDVSTSAVNSQRDKPLRQGLPVGAAEVADATTHVATGCPDQSAPDQPSPPGELAPYVATTPTKGQSRSKLTKRQRWKLRHQSVANQNAAPAAEGDISRVHNPSAGSSAVGGGTADTDSGDDREEGDEEEEDGEVKGVGPGDRGTEPAASAVARDRTKTPPRRGRRWRRKKAAAEKAKRSTK